MNACAVCACAAEGEDAWSLTWGKSTWEDECAWTDQGVSEQGCTLPLVGTEHHASNCAACISGAQAFVGVLCSCMCVRGVPAERRVSEEARVETVPTLSVCARIAVRR